MLDTIRRQATMAVVNGDVVVTFPRNTTVTFAHRDPEIIRDDSYFGHTRISVGHRLPLLRATEQEYVMTLISMALVVPFQQEKMYLKKYTMTSFITRMWPRTDIGIIGNNGPGYFTNGRIKIKNRIVDVLIDFGDLHDQLENG